MEVDTTISRLQGVGVALSLDNEILTKVTERLQELWNTLSADAIIAKCEQSEEMKYRLGVCLLYISGIDAKFPYGPTDPSSHEIMYSFTVTQLLQTANLNVIDFFKSMRSLRELLSVSDAVMTHLIGVEKKFLITSPLHQKFEKMTDDIFQPNEKARSAEDVEMVGNDAKRLIWTLFVYAKELCMPGYRELFESFKLLLCCLDVVLQTMPAFTLKPPFDSIKMDATERPNESTILQALCSSFHADIAEISRVVNIKTTCLEPLIKTLYENNAFDVDNIASRYTELYRAHGDINELLFFSHDPHLTVALPRQNRNKPENEEEAEAKLAPPSTPVRAAVTVVQSLQHLVRGCNPEPSPQLLNIFKNCSIDPTNILLARVSTIRQRLMECYSAVLRAGGGGLRAGQLVQDMASERVQLAVTLFYKQLEALLKMEEERLSQRDFSHLLNNTTFCTCLLACSIQVVLHTYTHIGGVNIQSPMSTSADSGQESDFPWILDTLEIQAFDFFKVIESFVRAEPNLSTVIVKHLQQMESRIVEKLAWRRDSPLFASLERCQVLLPTIPQTPPAGTRPDMKIPVSSAPQLYLSPMRPHGNIKPPITPTRDVTRVPVSPGKPAIKSHSLSLFLNRVCKLAFQRLQRLCSLLNIPVDMRHKIWTCLEYCVTKRPELLQNRHLDLMLLCSIYAICKISEKEIKFKSIVSAYRHLPHSCQEVYKSIEIVPGETESIINFYNRVFMQKLKGYLVQFSVTPVSTKISPLTHSPLTHSPLTRAPMSPMTRQLQASPVVSLPGRSNFFISPLIESPFKVPMSPGQLTPSSRQTLSFGEGPASSEKLKAINAALRSPPSGGPRSQKRLRFDAADGCSNGENGSDVIVVRRVHLNSPAAKSLDFTSVPQNHKVSEGNNLEMEYRGPVQNTLRDMLGGVRSTCTYVAAMTLKQLPKRTTFIRTTQQINDVFNAFNKDYFFVCG